MSKIALGTVQFGIDYGIIMASETKEKNAFAGVQVVSVDTLRARAINKKKIPE